MLFFGRKAKNRNLPKEFDLASSSNILDWQINNLSKKEDVDLRFHEARIAVVMDNSGSMRNAFINGDVQTTLSRLLPLGIKFSTDNILDVFVFNNICEKLDVPMTINNYTDYVQKEIMSKRYIPGGGTSYAPIIQQTLDYYFIKSDCTSPVFVIVITDGNNNDTGKTDNKLRDASDFSIFYQFIGIGDETFRYLKGISDLDDGKISNTSFSQCETISNLDDAELYNILLSNYSHWLKIMNLG